MRHPLDRVATITVAVELAQCGTLDVVMEVNWFLESRGPDGETVRRPIHSLPCAIGRDPSNDLVVNASGMSRRHALLDTDEEGLLRIVDLGSTNGTFVNRRRISGPRRLRANDVLHFGTAEFRITRVQEGVWGTPAAAPRQSELPRWAGDAVPAQARQDFDPQATTPLADEPPPVFPMQEMALEDLLGGVGLDVAVQPIIAGLDGRLFAWELLGRAQHPDLPQEPAALFELASRLGRECDLSQAFRRHGVSRMATQLQGARLFVNTHPKELLDDGFADRIARLREEVGLTTRLVVELPEPPTVDLPRLRELTARLRAQDIGVACDEWGGHEDAERRLSLLRPQFVKFDKRLMRGLHQADSLRQARVRDLVSEVLDAGAVALAEGIENEDDAELCRDMGFALLQGFHTGRPLPLEQAAALG
ncbi:MAG: hypothetical protein RIQ53_958 [Pseudomonadota bacterium]|jgi:EAL domain-containing protein (putative c-di-GMP-specific phosphodiesterase class I)